MRIRDGGIALALTALAAACRSAPWWSETLQTWRGAPQREVLAVWGPPDLESSTPEGKLVMVYETLAEIDARALESYELSRAADPASQREPPAEFTCKTYFELEAGVVTRIYARGSGCDPKPRPAQPR